MYQIRVEFSFDSGHRVLEHNGKCIFPHGHSYKAEVWLSSETLNPMGFVFDFTELKRALGSWIDKNWDHAFLLNSKDVELLNALATVEGSRTYLFSEENPTAEVMARQLFLQTHDLCGVAPNKVRVWESRTQYGEYSCTD